MDPYDPTTPQTGPPGEPRKNHHWYRPRNVALGTGALLVALVVIGVAGGGGQTTYPHSPPPHNYNTSGVTAVSATPATDINGITCVPSTMTDGYCPGDEPVPATTAPVQPAVYHVLTAHKWALIAKDPDAHAGETYIVYGEVTQFDANTGASAFRADVGAVRQYPDDIGFVDYPTNTVLDGDTGTLGPVVEKDLFTAKVTVTGSLSYDTTLGGSTTVPELQIDKITVTGHVSG
jgi:hypothetical protein